MKKGCTLKDIADHVGVSSSTVSRVLSRTTTRIAVSESTRRRIMEAIDRFGYTPDANAQGLAGKRASMIAVVVPSSFAHQGHLFDSYFFIMLLRELEQQLISHDSRMMLVFNNEKFLRDREYLRLFSSRSISAMIVWGATTADRYLRELEGRPVIQVMTRADDSDRISYVGHDIAGGAERIGRFLADTGRRRIICVSGPAFSSHANDHRRGLENAFDACGIVPLDRTGVDTFGENRGYQAMKDLIASGAVARGLDAVTFPSDGLARGAARAAREAGIAVPGELVVTGFEGTENNADTLVSCRTDDSALCRLAAENVFRMEDRSLALPFRQILPVELKIPAGIAPAP